MVAQSRIYKIKPAGFFILMVRRLDATNKIKELVEGLIAIGLFTPASASTAWQYTLSIRFTYSYHILKSVTNFSDIKITKN